MSRDQLNTICASKRRIAAEKFFVVGGGRRAPVPRLVGPRSPRRFVSSWRRAAAGILVFRGHLSRRRRLRDPRGKLRERLRNLAGSAVHYEDADAERAQVKANAAGISGELRTKTGEAEGIK